MTEEKKVVITKPVIGTKYVALKTMSVQCNKIFHLVEGKRLPDDFSEKFATSLINSKIIKKEV